MKQSKSYNPSPTEPTTLNNDTVSTVNRPKVSNKPAKLAYANTRVEKSVKKRVENYSMRMPRAYSELGPGHKIMSDSIAKDTALWTPEIQAAKENKKRDTFNEYFRDDERFVERNYKNISSSRVSVKTGPQSTAIWSCSFDPEEELTQRLSMQHFHNTPIRHHPECQARIDMINCSRDRAIRMQAAAVKSVAEKAPRWKSGDVFSPNSRMAELIVINKREQCDIRELIGGIALMDLYSMFESFGIDQKRAADILKDSRRRNTVKIEPNLGYNISYLLEASTHLEIANLCDLKEDMEYIATKQAVIDLSSKPHAVSEPSVDFWSRRNLYKTACDEWATSDMLTRDLKPRDKNCRAAAMQLIASGVGIPKLQGSTLPAPPPPLNVAGNINDFPDQEQPDPPDDYENPVKCSDAMKKIKSLENSIQQLHSTHIKLRETCIRDIKNAKGEGQVNATMGPAGMNGWDNSDGWWKDPYKLLWVDEAHRNRTITSINSVVNTHSESDEAIRPSWPMLPGHRITVQELKIADWGDAVGGYDFKISHASPPVIEAFKELKLSVEKGKLRNASKMVIREKWLNTLSRNIFMHFMKLTEESVEALEECIESWINERPWSANEIGIRIDKCVNDHMAPLLISLILIL